MAEYFIKDLRNKYPNKKYFIFPTYSDLSIYLSEEKARFKRYICTVAVLSPIKNIETLIEALHKVRKRAPEFKLVIVGDGPSRGGLEQLVNKLSLLDSVIFTGKSLRSSDLSQSIKDRIGIHVTTLQPLSDYGAVELLSKRLGEHNAIITDEAAKFVFGKAGRNTKKFLELSSWLFSILKPNEHSIKLDDAKKVLRNV